MSGRLRVFVLILVMTLVVACVAGVELYVLYHAAFEQQQERLIETAQSQARLLEAMLGHEEEEVSDHGEWATHAEPLESTLDQVRDAHRRFRGFGETGEFTLARLEHDQIVFLLSHRHFDLENPQPVALASDHAEPMRRALSGESGTMVGLDYRGERVLAAHEPVAEAELGIVAKIDLAEIQAPLRSCSFLWGRWSSCGLERRWFIAWSKTSGSTEVSLNRPRTCSAWPDSTARFSMRTRLRASPTDTRSAS